ncbi:hypothetical protein BaRGS_00031829 [Batillaria attramentaria]|uniref:Uncharacterized protein n=1 Tax=Batillaria attramentaria TaxID=370345 RepID=A0ABD0JQK7_9CAEN
MNDFIGNCQTKDNRHNYVHDNVRIVAPRRFTCGKTDIGANGPIREILWLVGGQPYSSEGRVRSAVHAGALCNLHVHRVSLVEMHRDRLGSPVVHVATYVSGGDGAAAFHDGQGEWIIAEKHRLERSETN